MQEQQQDTRFPRSVVAGISAAILAAGGGIAWWAWNSLHSPTTTSPPETSQLAPPSQQAQPPQQETVRVYWLNPTTQTIELVPSSVTVDNSEQPSQTIERAMQTLLAEEGKSKPELTTTIPEGTTLRSVSMQQDGIHVDLSQEFTQGGGSTSMTGRVGQVLYTATSLDPNAKVWVEVEGQPIKTLGGEGVLLKQPMTRQSFQKNFQL
ncbi:MAG: spore germination protein [Cyanobacteria bacterium QH_1_48_107]|nr:MAG: spore germination protein [Cyanobacteria bacterium QH_1_48_107]